MANVVSFVVWAVIGAAFVVMGIRAFSEKEAVGFWANVKTAPIEDVAKYNRAVGKLFIGFGGALVLCGLPLLLKQKAPVLIVSCIGTLWCVIISMVIYMRIESRYRKEQ